MNFSFGDVNDRGEWIELVYNTSRASIRKSKLDAIMLTEAGVQLDASVAPIPCIDSIESTNLYNYLLNII